MASQITSLTMVYSTVYSGADQRKHQSSASLAFVRGIHRWPVNFPHKGPVTRKMFPFDDVIMNICFSSKMISIIGLNRKHIRAWFQYDCNWNISVDAWLIHISTYIQSVSNSKHWQSGFWLKPFLRCWHWVFSWRESPMRPVLDCQGLELLWRNLGLTHWGRTTYDNAPVKYAIIG